ncbi:hypothetical protein [Haloparvum sp. AD34]
MQPESRNGSADSLSDGSDGTKWESYSNYEQVSRRVSKSVADALDAYALLHSAHQEQATIQTDLAADARSDILSAALRLVVEIRKDRESVEEYDEILERWEGDDGYIAKFQDATLHQQMPGWMFQFVLDIREAAWELGYLQAGRRTKQEPESEVERDTEKMFEGM